MSDESTNSLQQKKDASHSNCGIQNGLWGLIYFSKLLEHDRKQQILQFFLDVVAESGTTFEQKLLFARGIDTIEPQNIEAILSTQFSGRINSETAAAFR
ncbi:n-alkane-inducible cytochrome P450 [Penicillium canescens]|uniref:N-alkane-inducible cytochrome P450 n=1 Tax=Penicillium canescens TaxID=5083 RepID=A0AAD6ICT1_PENCN|nr:n-alkane-inducible cytochrome P450 [Penicillium canescens]KAJ5997597.1 n-alkane-inducible cytochrome P450 [Penicillium canescens]KAJ6043583.1 n-alkane-inducible cytochrome P450 [Penicillium canescens]KAJ6055057.1 n-alkane-inducible cytochrome P450 [Penicillium canescens]KAJ6074004.1 n-alkane-inducible cytochrome P450 [Penicillium canescens]KAJ6081134.1 n-alkane-inducible cytochrome P450 [Penicillium canescens]